MIGTRFRPQRLAGRANVGKISYSLAQRTGLIVCAKVNSALAATPPLLLNLAKMQSERYLLFIRQFLIAVPALTPVSGVVGVLAGLACPFLVVETRRILSDRMPHIMRGLPDVIQTSSPVVIPWFVMLAFGISVVIGIVFGLYPAIRAASLDPIEALRHE